MDSTLRHLPAGDETGLSTISGPLCLMDQPSSSTVCLSSPRSSSNSDRYLPLRLAQVEELDIPTSNLVAKDPQQDQHGQSNSFDPSPLLARSAMVSTAVGDTGRLPTSTASPSLPDLSSFRNGNETSPPEQTPSDGMARIRERYRTTGLSESATRILLSSWSEATQKRYSGPWNAWASWCNKRSLCPFTAHVGCILSFLAELSDQDNLAYRTIGVYRSAISQTHDPIGTVPVEELPIVSRFMKGMFRLNPPKPKLCTTWPVRDVLSFIRTQKPVTGLSLKDLSWRLVLLLALISEGGFMGVFPSCSRQTIQT